MRTIILAFGPDHTVAEQLARREVQSHCNVTVDRAAAIHVDDSTKDDVHIVTLYHMKYRVVRIEAEHFDTVIYEFTDKKHDGFAVLDHDLNLHAEEGKPISKLVVYREPSDYSPSRIVWSEALYFPTLTSRKLSGKKLNLKG